MPSPTLDSTRIDPPRASAHSAAIARPRPEPPTPNSESREAWTLTKRRKTVANALEGRVALPPGWTAPDLLRHAGIDGRRRPDTLTPDEWVALARTAESGSG